MHTHNLDRWTHDHVFLGGHHGRNERRTWAVVILTATMMGAEIVGGAMFGSMALIADGWHMTTHAAALAISGLAYLYARRHAHDQRYVFGTGKLGDLGGFTSAIVLAMIALLIAYESCVRLAAPVPIAYAEAVGIAVVGLLVNLASAGLLRHDPDNHHPGHTHHDHSHHDPAHQDREHDHHNHRDLNLRAAYLHVLADALTSVLAIAGLLAAWFFDWVWVDPLVGLIGALVITSWAVGLMRDAGAVLLDAAPDGRLTEAVRAKLEIEGDRVSDLHLWRIGPGHNAAIVAIVSDHPRPPEIYKARLSGLTGVSHITVEVNRCVHNGYRAA